MRLIVRHMKNQAIALFFPDILSATVSTSDNRF